MDPKKPSPSTYADRLRIEYESSRNDKHLWKYDYQRNYMRVTAGGGSFHLFMFILGRNTPLFK